MTPSDPVTAASHCSKPPNRTEQDTQLHAASARLAAIKASPRKPACSEPAAWGPRPPALPAGKLRRRVWPPPNRIKEHRAPCKGCRTSNLNTPPPKTVSQKGWHAAHRLHATALRVAKTLKPATASSLKVRTANSLSRDHHTQVAPIACKERPGRPPNRTHPLREQRAKRVRHAGKQKQPPGPGPPE